MLLRMSAIRSTSGETTLPRGAALFRLSWSPWEVAAVIAVITAFRLLWLAAAPEELYPDEAQYWFWAQHLAFGYYSKPPLIAWLIGLTTGAFGGSEFAIRVSAPLLHALAAFFVYRIGAELFDRRTGGWSAIAYATLPGVSLSSFIMSTDAALLPIWAAALYAFVEARATGGRAWWIAVGIACGLGLLAKYAMAYWMLSALAYVLLARRERKHLPPLLMAFGIALLIVLPNLWWNLSHGFVTFLHLKDNAALAGPLLHPAALVAFLGSQFGVFGPLFFATLIALFTMPGGLAEPRGQLLAAFTLPTLLLILALSLLSRAEANWAAPAYISATVLVVAWLLRRGRREVIIFSLALHVVAAALLFGGRDALAAAGIALPAHYDPLHRLRGWRMLGREVGAALAAHPHLRLLADDRETLAALIYYVQPHPFDAVKWALLDRVRDEWDLTNGLERHIGEDFLLVSAHNLIPEMRPSFAAIDRLGSLMVPLGPGLSRHYGLYLARDFKSYRR